MSENQDQRDAGKCPAVRKTSSLPRWKPIYREHGFHLFLSYPLPPTSVIRMWFELFIHCRSQWLHRAVILWKCHRYGSLHSLQAPHGRLSDPTDPCGELWAFGSSVDPPRHPHSASLCRPQHWRLEDPAQEPGSAGAMGGEWVSVGDTWCPCPSLVCVGRSLFLK